MGKWTLYHDFDELKCETIREAIKAGAVTDGEVVCGDIRQLAADDVRGFRRVHMFAGGGFRDLALNWAGWGDEPVWTGSCPCPSFSAAGKGLGFADPRHLWPDWLRLIGECRPPVVFGEQVSAAIGYGWLDLVQANLEAEAYAVGKIVSGAHSVGAPHIRQRLYFCAESSSPAEWRRGLRGPREGSGEDKRGRSSGKPVGSNAPLIRSDTGHWDESYRCEVAGQAEGPGSEVWEQRLRDEYCADSEFGSSPDTDGRQPSDRGVQRGRELGLFAQECGVGERGVSLSERFCGRDQRGPGSRGREVGEPENGPSAPDESGDGREDAGSRSDTTQRGLAMRGGAPGSGGHHALAGESGDGDQPISSGLEGHFGDEREWRGPGWLDPHTARSVAAAGATRGWWRDCDWWYGRDGKWRPAGPGVQPRAHGSPARVGRLRLYGYGDGIVVPQAADFVKAYREARGR